MDLTPVSLNDLSDIRYRIALAPHGRGGTPEFLYVSFSGVYRSGSAGEPDARFILSALAAVQQAWVADGVIVDFTNLAYTTGDEMDWVFDAGRDPSTGQQTPLAIIVGDRCRSGLSTLAPDEYHRHCVDSLDKAVNRVRALRSENE